jgi:glyoxylase-like metal-dependent hydrolase (beta-lactamase superfamily II)
VGFRLLRLRTPTLPGQVNSYLIGHRQAVMVDPGTDIPGELDRLRERIWRLLGSGSELRMLLLTHHHRDHAAGASRLSEELHVPVAAHPLSLELLPRSCRPRWSLPLRDGARLSLEPGLDLEVLHTPGHAAGHLCLFEPRRRVLLCGDMVAGRGTILVDPEEGEMSSYLSSLERLASLEPELLLPGHGPPRTGGARVIGELIAHRRWREQRVLGSLRASPSPATSVARQAYQEILAGGASQSLWFLHWALAYRATLAHLIKLEADGLARRCGADCWALAQ